MVEESEVGAADERTHDGQPHRSFPSPAGAWSSFDRQGILTQREFLNFNAEDEANLVLIHEVIRMELDSIIEDFYRFLLQFSELQPFFRDKQRLDRLKTTQKYYLLTLGRHTDDPSYFEDRMRIGETHERVGLPHQWYLGAYVCLFGLIAKRLVARNSGHASSHEKEVAVRCARFRRSSPSIRSWQSKRIIKHRSAA